MTRNDLLALIKSGEIQGALTYMREYMSDPALDQIERLNLNLQELIMSRDEINVNQHFTDRIEYIASDINYAWELLIAKDAINTLPNAKTEGEKLAIFDKSILALKNSIAKLETMRTEIKEDENIPFPTDKTE